MPGAPWFEFHRFQRPRHVLVLDGLFHETLVHRSLSEGPRSSAWSRLCPLGLFFDRVPMGRWPTNIHESRAPPVEPRTRRAGCAVSGSPGAIFEGTGCRPNPRMSGLLTAFSTGPGAMPFRQCGFRRRYRSSRERPGDLRRRRRGNPVSGFEEGRQDPEVRLLVVPHAHVAPVGAESSACWGG